MKTPSYSIFCHCVVFFLTISSQTFAQFDACKRIGFHGSAILSKDHFGYNRPVTNGYKIENKFVLVPAFGIHFQKEYTTRWMWRTELNFRTLGNRSVKTAETILVLNQNYDYDTIVDYLEVTKMYNLYLDVPFGFGYKFIRKEKFYVSALAGVSVRYFIIGKINTEIYSGTTLYRNLASTLERKGNGEIMADKHIGILFHKDFGNGLGLEFYPKFSNTLYRIIDLDGNSLLLRGITQNNNFIFTVSVNKKI